MLCSENVPRTFREHSDSTFFGKSCSENVYDFCVLGRFPEHSDLELERSRKKSGTF